MAREGDDKNDAGSPQSAKPKSKATQVGRKNSGYSSRENDRAPPLPLGGSPVEASAPEGVPVTPASRQLVTVSENGKSSTTRPSSSMTSKEHSNQSRILPSRA